MDTIFFDAKGYLADIGIGVRIAVYLIYDNKSILHLLEYPLLPKLGDPEKLIPTHTDDNG